MKKVLVIEDNIEVRENIVEILELYGYEAEEAENGKIGVQKALESIPHLILCDVMMPELDGFGVLNILSKKPETAHIPFIFLTAKSEKEDWRRGMNLGADDYITKPFFKDELLQVIEVRLKKNDRLKQTSNNAPAFINENEGKLKLKQLSETSPLKKFKKQDNIFWEEDLPRYLYFVNTGKVKLYKTNEYGKELIIKVCGQGEFFGYTSLLENKKYNYAAQTLEETELRWIPKAAFLQLINDNRDVASQLIKLLANNVIEKEDQLLQLAYNSIRKRVADALISLSEHEKTNEIIIKREDLSKIVGTAKESVIRTLAEFKKDGYVDIKTSKIIILQKDKLRNMPD
jgi:CRP-like cAMP-binding protein